MILGLYGCLVGEKRGENELSEISNPSKKTLILISSLFSSHGSYSFLSFLFSSHFC